MLLLCIGLQFDKIIRTKDVERAINQVLVFSDKRGADVSILNSKKLEGYIERILNNPLKCSLSEADLTNMYRLFIMTKSTSRYFMEYCCKNIYKSCKNEKDYSGFAEFLKFMFENGTAEDVENTGKYLCKLSKQKLEELDKEMNFFFDRNPEAGDKWEEIVNVAVNTNSLMNNLSGLFKRKKI